MKISRSGGGDPNREIAAGLQEAVDAPDDEMGDDEVQTPLHKSIPCLS